QRTGCPKNYHSVQPSLRQPALAETPGYPTIAGRPAGTYWFGLGNQRRRTTALAAQPRGRILGRPAREHIVCQFPGLAAGAGCTRVGDRGALSKVRPTPRGVRPAGESAARLVSAGNGHLVRDARPTPATAAHAGVHRSLKGSIGGLLS